MQVEVGKVVVHAAGYGCGSGARNGESGGCLGQGKGAGRNKEKNVDMKKKTGKLEGLKMKEIVGKGCHERDEDDNGNKEG